MNENIFLQCRQNLHIAFLTEVRLNKVGSFKREFIGLYSKTCSLTSWKCWGFFSGASWLVTAELNAAGSFLSFLIKLKLKWQMEAQRFFDIVETFQILWCGSWAPKGKILLDNIPKNRRPSSEKRSRCWILLGLRTAVGSEATENHSGISRIGLWTNGEIWILEESKHPLAKPAFCRCQITKKMLVFLPPVIA